MREIIFIKLFTVFLNVGIFPVSSKTVAHDEEVRKLYEEMEVQIKQEKEKILSEVGETLSQDTILFYFILYTTHL